jgi:ankyrin repeat protein
LKHKGNPFVGNDDGETPLLLSVSDLDMLDVVKALLKNNDCDVNYKTKDGTTAMTRVLEVGNFEAFKLLLNVPELNLESYVYDHSPETKLTLLEYIYMVQFGPDYKENHKHARALLEIRKDGCYPLHMNRTNKISALMFAVGETGSSADDSIFVIGKLLEYAEKEDNKKYVDFKGQNGFAAFDLIFKNQNNQILYI